MGIGIAKSAQPRTPFPKSPDAIWQNDLDLSDRINVVRALISTNTTTDATKLTGLVPNSSIDGSSITKQGNIFNGASQLVQLDSGGNLSLSSVTATNLQATNLRVSTATWKGFGLLPILQVQSFSINTSSANSTATTFGGVNSNLTVAITPKLSTSKVMIFVSGTHTCAAGASCYLTIMRDNTNIGNATSGLSATASNNVETTSMIAYDSPATTSAINYRVGMRVDGGGSQAFPTNSFGTQPSSTIIAVEIAQ